MSIYEYIALNHEKQLNYSVPVNKILRRINRRATGVSMARVCDNIESITLKYSIKDSLGDLKRELQVFEIELIDPIYCRPIVNAFKQTIPYDILFIFHSGEKYLLAYDSEKSCEEGDIFKQFSGWFYEEELSTSFLELVGEEHLIDTEFQDYWVVDDKDRIDSISSIAFKMYCLLEALSVTEYVCIRRFIDLIKDNRNIDEGQTVKLLAVLVSKGAIKYLDDDIYAVRYSDAEEVFHDYENSSIFYSHVLKDRRVDSDKYFFRFHGTDCTSVTEAEDMVLQAIHYAQRPVFLVDDVYNMYDIDDMDDDYDWFTTNNGVQ